MAPTDSATLPRLRFGPACALLAALLLATTTGAHTLSPTHVALAALAFAAPAVVAFPSLGHSALLTPAQRHARRPDLSGREYKPMYGHKNDTQKDHGGNAMYLQRVASLIKTDPLAVCNDGSGAALYFRKGSDVSTWLIYLQGGEWCWSADSCALRQQQAPWLMSNTGHQLEPPATWMGGAFERNTARNPLGNINVAYAPYCSSDAWVGDIGASDATFGYQFRGQRIFAAAVRAVVAEGLGESAKAAAQQQLPPPTLIIGGCSAGSRGAMMNLDYVQGILQDAGVAPDGVTVVGMLDSPLWVDVQPFDPTVVSLQAQTQAIFGVINATARLGDACAAQYTGDEAWRCLFGEYRLPTLQTRFLVSASQDDRFQLSWNMAGNASLGYTPAKWEPAQLQYADAFAASMAGVISSLPTAAQAAAGSMVFSTACFHHCTSETAAFWNVGIDVSTLGVTPASAASGVAGPAPVSFRDALKLWLWPAAGAPAHPERLMQQCSGFRCGRCTTKLKHALAAGVTLASPPPVPGAAPTAPPTAAQQRRRDDARSSVMAMFAFAAVVGSMLGLAAREATRLVADAAPPPTTAFSRQLAAQREQQQQPGVYTQPVSIYKTISAHSAL